MNDSINHPSHYTQGIIECIEAIRAALTPEEFRGYCKGNAFKYNWREKGKGGNEDLEKAKWYLNQIVNTSKEVAREEIQYARFTGIGRAGADDLGYGRDYGLFGIDNERRNVSAPNQQSNDRCSPAPERLKGMRGIGGNTDLQQQGGLIGLEGKPGAEPTLFVDRGDHREWKPSGERLNRSAGLNSCCKGYPSRYDNGKFICGCYCHSSYECEPYEWAGSRTKPESNT